MEKTLKAIEGLEGLAYLAHYGTSFSPKKRAQQFVIEFKEDYQRFIIGIPDEYRESISEKYVKLLTIWLHAKSNCISSMIAGPSNFPVKRAEKANRRESACLNNFAEWKEKVTKRLNRKPKLTIDEEIIRLENKLDMLIENHELMKGVNRIVKSKKLEEEKIELLQQQFGFNEANAIKLLDPTSFGGVGFPSFSLTNNLAKIKSTKVRLAMLQRDAVTPEVEEEVNGVRLVQDARENRVRIYFEGKPSDEIRALLKKAAFKWSPSIGAWQNYLTERNVKVAKELLTQICLK